MKNKLLAASLLSVLALPAFAARSTDGAANTGTNDDADDLQSVSVTVPEVALLQVGNDPINITMPAPANAGDGFSTDDNRTDNTTELKISSNVIAGVGDAATTTRTLTASISEALPQNWKLSIDAGTLVGTDGTDLAIEGADTSAEILTGIANEKGTGSITYTFGPASDGAMMAYSDANDGAKSIEITYTLSGDS